MDSIKRGGIISLILAAIIGIILLVTLVYPLIQSGAGRVPGGELHITEIPTAPNESTIQGNTVYFSKYVSEDLSSIIVDLYSGDPDDPISVTIITPDRVLGPFYDASDGKADGRIFLRITRENGLMTGMWKFIVHSNKNITTGYPGHSANSTATPVARKPDIQTGGTITV
jgi:hypothetical protein